jgi:ABC-type bacteriocin/lantibiotic exporter with double-glycine peptidase domain
MTAIVLIIMLVAGGRAVASHDMTMGSLMSFYFCLACSALISATS